MKKSAVMQLTKHRQRRNWRIRKGLKDKKMGLLYLHSCFFIKVLFVLFRSSWTFLFRMTVEYDLEKRENGLYYRFGNRMESFMDAKKKAVVLLSGGLDSVTCLAVAKHEGFEVHALTFDYGQRHKVELDCARRSAEKIGVERFHLISFDLRMWGASALTSDKLEVPDYNPHSHSVPITYVPARNLIFLSFATALAEGLNARDIFIGVNSLDYSGYPDCRPEFIEAFRKCARLGTKAVDEGWEYNIRAPLQHLHKSGIIKLGLSLGVDYSMTHSCYNPGADGRACGRGDSCGLRRDAFHELGLEDPALMK